MKKFIIKISYFLLPVILLHIFTYYFYRTDKGDLLRVGYIMSLYPDYYDIFKSEFKNEIKFSRLSEQKEKKKFKALTIGDSFSEQGIYGYNNYLAMNNIDLLHIDRFISGNQFQTLYSLLKGDFFDQYSFDFVILQCIERDLIELIEEMETDKSLSCAEIKDLIEKKGEVKKADSSFKFPSDRVLKIPYNAVQYALNDDYLFDEMVIKTKINQDLFSTENKELLFFKHDIAAVEKNNNESNLEKLNFVLNDLNNLLKNKGIKLIFLPSPDKYDIYYNFITDKSNYPKPLFFDLFEKVDKNYICINSKPLLVNAVNESKDIYLYDDSHWSPKGTKIIADEIRKQIYLNDNNSDLID
ncbi:MAG: hypothetical protein IPM38_19530 [Ignavibacteria bacterium]|nr:hypothetical protein [Ignavibacteria bacterium]